MITGTVTVSVVVDTDSVSCWVVLMVISATAPSSARVDAYVVETDDVHKPDSSSS